jgi:MSHA biogenesis protein MshN
MSVINQMLRDLDARQASDQERAGLPAHLRTLPPTSAGRRQAWRTLALGMGMGALIAGILVSVLMAPASAPIAPTTAIQPNLPAPVAPATPAVPPAPTFAAPREEAPSPPPSPIDAGEMKLSTLLALAQPVVPPAAKPAPAATKPAPTPARPEQETAKPAPETSKHPVVPRENKAAAPTVEHASADTQIDKRARGGQGRELAEAEYRKGMQAVKRGENSAAQQPLQRALELDPTLAKARQALLSVLVGNKQWAEALQVAKSGLALDPAQSGWAIILARLQFEQGDTAAAVETLGLYLAYAGADADYHGLFAYLLQKQQRPAEASERFKTALSLRPNEGRWWFGLGLSLENAGRGDEAKEAYAQAKQVGNLPADMAATVEQKLR